MRNELILWRDVPMDVDMGSFTYIANHWGNDIFIICMKGYDSERKQCSWEKVTFPDNVHNIILENEELAIKLINEYPNAIHIFNGFRGVKQKYLKTCLKNNKTPKIGVIAERPFLYGSNLNILIKKIIFNQLYSFYRFRFGSKVSAFLPMGTVGVRAYHKYGWSLKKLYPYMYNPLLNSIDLTKQNQKRDKMHFLYLGRFDARAKGLDVLMKAVDGIENTEKWELDLVGGYGDIKEQTLEWAAKKSNVRFAGTWRADEIMKNMSHYDVCLVPSRYDGWNLTPNQAISCGIGTIITDQAGSDEIIKESGAGIVVNAGQPEAFRQAMEKVIYNPEILLQWKKKARNYADKISAQSVGTYFMDIMDYEFSHTKKTRPECPWINREFDL